MSSSKEVKQHAPLPVSVGHTRTDQDSIEPATHQKIDAASNDDSKIAQDNASAMASYPSKPRPVYRDHACNYERSTNVKSSAHRRKEIKDPSVPPASGQSPLLNIPAELQAMIITSLFPMLPNGRPELVLSLDKPPVKEIMTRTDEKNNYLQAQVPAALAILVTCRLFYHVARHEAYASVEWVPPVYLGRPLKAGESIKGMVLSERTASPNTCSIRFIRGTPHTISWFLGSLHTWFPSMALSNLSLAALLDPYDYVAGCLYFSNAARAAIIMCQGFVHRHPELRCFDLLMWNPFGAGASMDGAGAERSLNQLRADVPAFLEGPGTSGIHWTWYPNEIPVMRLTFERRA